MAIYLTEEDVKNLLTMEIALDSTEAMFVEKGIAKSLEPFIAKEANFAKDGYHKAMFDLGTFTSQVYV